MRERSGSICAEDFLQNGAAAKKIKQMKTKTIMKNPLLHAKHWQLVLLTAIPLGTSFFINEVLNYQSEVPSSISIYPFIFTWLLMISWILSVGLGLLKYIPEELRPNPRWFRVAFSMPIIYVAFIMPKVLFQSNLDSFLPLLIPFHLITMVSIVYCIFFIGRNIHLVHYKSKLEQFEIVGYIMLIMFYPIGIWILQPRINKAVQCNN
jgi:hypothetical protein